MQQQQQHIQHELQQLKSQQHHQPAITPSNANSGQAFQQPYQQQQPYQFQQQQQPALTPPHSNSGQPVQQPYQSQQQPAQNPPHQPVNPPLQSNFGQPFPAIRMFSQRNSGNAVSSLQQSPSTLIKPPARLVTVALEPNAKALSKRIHEVKQATSPYESKDDPDLWCDKLLSHAASHQLHYFHLIDHIKFFFEPSSDEQVKAWFDSYRDRIRVQQTADMPAEDIWNDLRKELISTFNLFHRTRKAEMELSAYIYTNESADEYINKVRNLTRKANGHATEEQIVKNLYDHLSTSLKTHLGLAPWHTNISDFRLSFSALLETLQLRKPQKHKSHSILLAASQEEDEEDEPQHYVRRMQSPNFLCWFCNRGPHKAQDCWNLQEVVVKLLPLDKKLTPQMIYDDLVLDKPCHSPAIQAFRDDPDAFMPPSRRRDPNPHSGDPLACDYNAIIYGKFPTANDSHRAKFGQPGSSPPQLNQLN